MRSALPILAFSLLAGIPASAAQTSPTRVEPAVLRELAESPDGRALVVVVLEQPTPPGTPTAAARAAIAEAQEVLLAELATTGFELRCRYATFAALAGRADEAALTLLGQHELVRRVGSNGRFTVALDQSVPHIRADQVHALGLTGEGLTVAVLDTGIDTDHADLADDLAPGAWHSLNDGTDQGPGAEDDNGHGTHVSGIITSAGNVAPLGAAPDVEILAVKILDAGGGGTLIDVLAGIDYVTANAPNYANLCALNMSLSTFFTYSDCPCDNADTLTMGVQISLQAAKDAGIVCMVASGNHGTCTSMGAPACVTAATAVAATGNANDTIAGFASRSACNELAAPGEDITAPGIGGGTDTKSGTSMATPHAAAVAALVCQQASLACTTLTPDEIVQLLKDTGVSTNDPCGSSPNPLRVDALAAVQAISGGPGTLICFGDGSGTACPCGNESGGADCAGCRNSGGAGATARAAGSASVSADDLVVSAAGAPPSRTMMLLAGTQGVQGGAGKPFGDGLRCAGGNVALLGLGLTQMDGSASFGPGLAAQNGWMAGDQRVLQAWYRDPVGSPCGEEFNLSNGVELTLEP